jgi:hypothetical protein
LSPPRGTAFRAAQAGALRLLLCIGLAAGIAGCAAPVDGAGGIAAAGSSVGPAGGAGAPAPGEAGRPAAVLAVRTPAGDSGLAAALRETRFVRRALPRLTGVRVEIGPAAAGTVEVLVDVAPAATAAARSGGLPLRFGPGAIELGGSRYAAPGQAVAARQPRAPHTTWLVVGVTADGAVALADRLLFELAAAMGGFAGAGGMDGAAAGAPALGFDYLVREAPRLERSGRWRQAAQGAAAPDAGSARAPDLASATAPHAARAPAPGRSSAQAPDAAGELAPDGAGAPASHSASAPALDAAGQLAPDAAGERDDLRDWQRAAAKLRELPGSSVTLLVPPSRLAGAGRADMERLAAALDGAAAAMAPRLSGDLPRHPRGPGAPIVVAVEDDFVAQARHTGQIGEAVPAAAPEDRAEIHLVYHPDDLFAYRVALAERLIARAGLAGSRANAEANDPSASRGGAGAAGASGPTGAAGSMGPTGALPPWLARGAALWLAGSWYGRPYKEWLPRVAGAAALPSVAELLAPGMPPEGPAALWTPVAAALLDHLPGATLAAKLDAARRLAPGEVDAWLSGIAALQLAVADAAVGTTAGAPLGKGDGPSAVSGTSAGAARRAPLPPLRGVSLAMENSLEGGYHAPVLDRQLDRLAALGVNAVSLMPFAYQEGPAVPRLHMLNASPESETDVGLVHAVRRARAHGLRTLYKPHVWVGGGSWPGDIAMPDEAAWQAWWRDYRRYVLHHAVLARWSGADVFSIGCELSGTLGRADDWRRLIAAVRRVFPGELTYAGNWSGDLERAPFWEQLDLVGVDAYFPLSADPAAGRAELARGAATVVARLAAASRSLHRPLLLTEVGFAASRAAWTAPHREGGTPSQADQAAAYSALFQALGKPPWLAGTFIWKAFSGEIADPAPASSPAAARRRRRDDEADFRFLGRQAEAVIAAYYAGAR